MSEYVPRSCRVGAARGGICNCFLGGNAGCEAAHNVFHACNLCRKSGYCLEERLDAIFDSGRVLQEKR